MLARASRADVQQGQQPEVSPDQISHLKDAVQFYGQSLANYYDAEVERKHERFVEELRQAYTSPKLSQFFITVSPSLSLTFLS